MTPSRAVAPSSPAADGEAGDSRAVRGATLSVAVSVILLGVAAFLPAERLWGVNHLAFYPIWLRVGALGLLVLVFVPAVARGIHRGGMGLVGGLERMSPARFAVVAAVSVVVSIALFHGFRTATLLWGDGRLIAHTFELAAQGDPEVLTRDAKTIVTADRISPATTLLYHGAAQLLGGIVGSPVAAIRVVSCLLGGLFVGAILVVVRRGSVASGEKVWVLGLGLFTAPLQLFFGYVENYALLQLLLLLHAITAIMAMRGACRVGWPVAILVLALAAHVQALAFVPSLLWLLLWKAGGRWRGASLSFVPPVLEASTVIAALLARFTFLSDDLLPLLQVGEYGVLSLRHLADVANLLLLLLPIVPLAIVLWLTRLRVEAGSSPSAAEGRAASFGRRPEETFVGILLTSCLVYLFFVDPKLGMARDWDRFAMLAIPLGGVLLVALGRVSRAWSLGPGAMAAFTGPALAVLLVTAWAWHGIQASRSRSVARLEQVLALDERVRSAGYEDLAAYYRDVGDLPRSVELLERAYADSKNPRLAVQTAQSYEALGRRQDAIALLTPIVTRRPDLHEPRFLLVQLLARAARWEEVVELAGEGVRLHPGHAVYLYFLGQSLLETGRTQEAVAAFRRCSTGELPPGARRYVVRVLEQYGTDE